MAHPETFSPELEAAVMNAAVKKEAEHHPELAELPVGAQREVTEHELKIPIRPDEDVLLEGVIYRFDPDSQQLELRRDPTTESLEHGIVELAEMYGWGDFATQTLAGGAPNLADAGEALQETLEKLTEKTAAHQATKGEERSDPGNESDHTNA